jgi:hypothetical protein
MDRVKVNARIQAINKNYFETSGGDIRALIANVDARELIRIVLDDESTRNNPDVDCLELRKHNVLKDVFRGNGHSYSVSEINKIVVLCNEPHRFFYLNNGVTIICDEFQYSKSKRAPVIELENFQVVNGSKIIHALYKRFLAGSSYIEDIEILCRIYKTKNSFLIAQIADG